MSLNTGAINSKAINGTSGFTSATGSTSISVVQLVAVAASTSIDVIQEVGSQATSSSSLIQVVELHTSGSASYNIQQVVAAKASTSLDVEQIIVNLAAQPPFYDRNGYEPRIYLAGQRIDNDQIHGNIEITFQEDQAPQAKFTLIPDTGTQDIRGYRGKSIVISIRQSSGTTKVFTGTVNEPDVHIIDQKVTLICSLDIEQKVEALSRSFINSIGLYNNKVFSKAKTKEQELRDRISTVAKTIDWLPSGTIKVDNIAPKSSPDYTLTNSDVYRDGLDYKFSSRQRYINSIEITCKYSFTRLHHHERNFSASDGISDFCDFALNAKTPMRRDLVMAGIQGMGWVISQISFSDFFSGGNYRCGDITIGLLGEICEKTSSANAGVTINGSNQITTQNRKCANGTGAVTRGASWRGSVQFAQTINQDYVLTVKAPQSISSYGIKKKEDSFSLADTYDASDWEDYKEYNNQAPDGFSKAGTQNLNFWVDARQDVGLFSQSVNIMLNKAKAEILKSHRDDIITFKRSLWPQIQLQHTVRLNTDRIDCKGKVRSYKHIINVNTGEAYTDVDLVFSRSEGSQSEDGLGLPSVSLSAIDPTYDGSIVVWLGKHGVDVTAISEPQGFFGNRINRSNGNGELTSYPVAFVAKQPEIDDQLRTTKSTSNSSSFNISIPNDSLTINFTDDNYL